MLSPHEVCTRVRKLSGTELPQVTPRPWNRHSPEETDWWRVPGTEWPAYRRAKYYFARSRDSAGDLEIGLYIEKGLDPSVREAYPSKKGAAYIMDPQWAWFQLIAPSAHERLASAVARVGPERPLEIRLQAGNVLDPGSFNPTAPRPDGSMLHYAVAEDGGLSPLAAKDAARHLHAVFAAASIRQLLDGLRLLQHDAWLCVDSSIFARYSAESQAHEDLARTVWNEHLRHFAEWLISQSG